MEKGGLDLGPLSEEDGGTRTLLQLIRQGEAPAFGQRIDLHKAASQDAFASLASPRSPLVPPASDMLLDFGLTVSATTIKLGMKASERCQGTRGAGAGGTVCQPGRRVHRPETGSLSQTPPGRHVASNKGKGQKEESAALHPFGLARPPHPRNQD